ncbi:MAG TPA: hypothetical protein VF342_01555 [Alphaproteobacteria bacterium]
MDSLELGAVPAGGLGLVLVGIGLIAMTMALYHLFILGRIHLEKQRLTDSIGPVAFIDGGFFAERVAYHRHRLCFHALAVAVAALMLLLGGPFSAG